MSPFEKANLAELQLERARERVKSTKATYKARKWKRIWSYDRYAVGHGGVAVGMRRKIGDKWFAARERELRAKAAFTSAKAEYRALKKKSKQERIP